MDELRGERLVSAVIETFEGTVLAEGEDGGATEAMPAPKPRRRRRGTTMQESELPGLWLAGSPT